MLIRPSTIFAHPVLSPHTEDYGDRVFDITLEVEEIPDAGEVKLNGIYTLDDAATLQLISSGQAITGIVVECLETYFQRFIPLTANVFTLEFNAGELRGRVAVQAVISTTQEKIQLVSEYIEPDYPPHTKRLTTGSVIALSSIHTFEAGLDKLLPMESIFHLAMNDDVADGMFNIELDSEAIRIEVASTLYNTIYGIRGTSIRDILLPSLFLPAVMNALDSMRIEGYEGHRWHRVIQARCGNEGIIIDSNTDLARAAQQLLEGPLGLLRGMFKEGNE